MSFSNHSFIKLPALVSNGMILQHDSTVHIWGWYDGNDETISLSTDWSDSISKSKINGNYWDFNVRIPEFDHIFHSLRIFTSDDSVEINGILFGEVWFAGGQSNMEMKMKGYWRAPVDGSNREIAEASSFPEIRMFTVERNASLVYQEYFSGKWETASSSTLVNWSATSWFFAKHLYNSLRIPVGVIVASWGGSTIEAWMPKEDVQCFDDINFKSLEQFDGTQQTVSMNAPYLMYYGMFKPITKYTVKGILFYQGESNVGRHKSYSSKLQKLVLRWRDDFGIGDIPFYFVEITPYVYDPRQNGMGIFGALLREAQFKAQSLIPNSQMICTNDLVGEWEKDSIHPSQKEPVGERLAWCALSRDYGLESVCCTYPYLKEAKFNSGSDKVEISFVNSPGAPQLWTDFTNATGGKNDPHVMYYLLSQLSGVVGFEVAGDDKVFHQARIVGLGENPSSFIVSSSEVSSPVAVRYCFHDFSVGNLINQRGMPTIPFRTDSW